jgi:hypothetical protein
MICLLASVAHAQSETAGVDPEYAHYREDEPAQTRRLHNHVFLTPILQETAFVTTHVGINEGAAVYDVPDVPVGRFGTRDVTLSGFQETLDLGFRIFEWLGLSGHGQAIAITGVDAESIVIDGVTVDVSAEGGAVARIYRNDKIGTQLGVRARVSYRVGQELPLLAFVQTVADAPIASVGEVIDGNLGELLFVPTHQTTLIGSLHGAQYFNPFLALQLAATFKYSWDTREPIDPRIGERIQEDTNTFRTELAAALELSFDPLHVPLSLQGEFLMALGNQEYFEAPDRSISSSTFGFGVYYVGRPNLQFGIGGVATLSASPRRGVGRQGETEYSGDPTLAYFDLILRYIW